MSATRTEQIAKCCYLLQGLSGDLHGRAPSLHDGHGVDALVHQELSFSQELTAQDRHTK